LKSGTFSGLEEEGVGVGFVKLVATGLFAVIADASEGIGHACAVPGSFSMIVSGGENLRINGAESVALSH